MAGVIETYRSVNQTLLAFDGVEYFSSPAIHGPNGSTRQHANGPVTYSHTVLTPVLVKPGLDKVIPLAPEFVRPQDGVEKQDCELNAAKRWLAEWGDDYSPLKITVLGDDLYCHEPFCRDALNRGFDFILVCKPDSHAIVAERLEFLDRGGAVKTVVRRRWTGQRREIDTYRYADAIPLCATGMTPCWSMGASSPPPMKKVTCCITTALQRRRPATSVVRVGQPHHPGLSGPYGVGVDG